MTILLVPYIKVKENIYVEEQPPACKDFLFHVRLAIRKISSCELGAHLFEKIAATEHQIRISFEPNSCSAAPHSENCIKEGCGTDIKIDLKQPQLVGIKHLEHIPAPFFLMLIHELIHAYHNAYGKNLRDSCTHLSKVWTNDEEFETIAGIDTKKRDRELPKITENAFRRIFKLPLRFSHWRHCGPFPAFMRIEAKKYLEELETKNDDFIDR
jgi:hypothetical protein